MKFNILVVGALLITLAGCDTELRNIANVTPPDPKPPEIEVTPIAIRDSGIKFLSQMQGHWVGQNRVIADDFEWFGFDYRLISPSHVHGIFEGGTMGNLFTSFFVADFEGTRTLMARNGGVLNGIYRTSYFVLDSLNTDANGDFYRFSDAEGGINTMWMELLFKSDSLYFNAYTSRLGGIYPPGRHMTFRGKKEHLELAQAAQDAVGVPSEVPAFQFPQGFIKEHLNAEPGAKSATFLSHDPTNTKDVFTLAAESGDPFTIDQHPRLGYLLINIESNPAIAGKTKWINLSRDPLTTQQGYFHDQNAFNTVLLFPELIGTQNTFLVTYLHPGDYYINITADVNEDGFIGQGDYTHPLQSITIDPEGQHEITVQNITVEN